MIWRSGDRIIIIFPTTADYRGRTVGALRVRIPPPKTVAEAQNVFAPPAAPIPPATNGNAAPANPVHVNPASTVAQQSEPDPDLDDEIPF